MNLPTGTYLQGGKYRITRFIGSGGFGCTYEAFHTELEERVAIKEFFVKNFCNRDESTARGSVATQSQKALVEKLRSKFKDEAKAMFRLRHPGIVRVSDVFEENGTVYYVMDFIEGRSLQAIVEEEGRLPEHRAMKYVRQVADALRYIHGHNRLHLDVKPGNIMVDGSDNAILIDFGASKQYDEENGENTSTLVGKTPGYAPLEQMSNKVVRFFPATDIYALGATLYKLLTGVTPPDAAMLASGGEELSPLPFTVSGNTSRAVSSAMSLKKDDRPQDIGDFLNILDGGRTKNGTGQSRPSGDSRSSEDTTMLDEKKNDGGNGRGGNGGDVRGCDDKGVGEGGPSSSPNPNRAKRWIIAACVIVCLVAGYILLRGLMSGGGHGGSVVTGDSTLVAHTPDNAMLDSKDKREASDKEAAAKATTGFINGHEWVDLGLSVKWATCNVGASSPSDYGNCYAWGETRTKSEYTGYNSSTHGKSMGDISGDIRYDAARANWGGTWRLPTEAEMQDLVDKCTWTWTRQGGHIGYRVTGPNGSSIFLPGESSPSYSGYYWSSTPDESSWNFAYCLIFHGDDHYLNWDYRYDGLSIRPVSD